MMYIKSKSSNGVSHMQKKLDSVTSDIRSFNRFYTKKLGLFNQHLLESDFSLTEARVIYEINHTKNCTANSLIEELGIDKGFMSRILKKLESDGLIGKEKSSTDGRTYILCLTPSGTAAFSKLNEQSDRQIQSLIAHLSKGEYAKLIEAMKYIRTALNSDSNPVNIRTFQIKDIEYITKRHMELYAAEYGFDHTFGEYVSDAVNKFVEAHDAAKENIWIAEVNGKPVGSIALVKAGDSSAQLRWFLIEPHMRGKGLGHKLMTAALNFCREKGYKHVLLWTVSTLETARHLYKSYGFHLKETAEHDIWGNHLVEERWDLDI